MTTGPDGTIALPLESPGTAHTARGTAPTGGSMHAEPNPACADCNRPDDTDGEWFAYSVQFAAFLCYQCYQARHAAKEAA